MCVKGDVGLRMKEKEISVFHIKKTMSIQMESNKIKNISINLF